MNPKDDRTSTPKKGQRGDDDVQQRAQQLRLSEQRTQKAATRAQPETLQPSAPPQGYASIMRDLLKDPVSLGLKGGFRGHQR